MKPDADVERTKLLANSLDRVSTACLTVGVFAPLAAAYFSPPAALEVSTSALIASVCVWFLSALGLHLAARNVLGGLST